MGLVVVRLVMAVAQSGLMTCFAEHQVLPYPVISSVSLTSISVFVQLSVKSKFCLTVMVVFHLKLVSFLTAVQVMESGEVMTGAVEQVFVAFIFTISHLRAVNEKEVVQTNWGPGCYSVPPASLGV